MGAGLGISTLFERLVYLQEVSAGGGIDPTAPAEGSIVAAEAGAQPMEATSEASRKERSMATRMQRQLLKATRRRRETKDLGCIV
jgi:hypothetical protein